MKHYKYLIIGGGMTAASGAQGIREIDSTGTIGIISAEPDPPYNRPPLTKGLWKGKPFERIWRKVDLPALDIHLETEVDQLDPEKKTARSTHGVIFGYEKLLLATGGSPRKLDFGGEEILYYRTVADYHKLRTLLDQGDKFAVLGGGFIGSEIAAAICNQNKKVVMIFPEEGIGWNLFPPDLSAFINEYYRGKGVEVLAGDLSTGLSKKAEKYVLSTKSQKKIEVDAVIAGIGIVPNLQLAESAGLEVGDGIVVDEYLMTSHPDIYAAGDVAFFYTPILDLRQRVEHEQNANVGGKTAGRNMAGARDRYTLIPMFYSDLFDLGYEAVGEINPQLDTLPIWQEPFRKGIIYYLSDRQVRGVLLWNVWDQVDNARKIIESGEKSDPVELKSLLA